MQGEHLRRLRMQNITTVMCTMIIDNSYIPPDIDNRYICDLIYRNRSKLHIGSYEIIDFKDFNTL